MSDMETKPGNKEEKGIAVPTKLEEELERILREGNKVDYAEQWRRDEISTLKPEDQHIVYGPPKDIDKAAESYERLAKELVQGIKKAHNDRADESENEKSNTTDDDGGYTNR